MACAAEMEGKEKFEAGDDHETQADIDSLNMLDFLESALQDHDKPHQFHIERTKTVVEVVDLWIK